MRMAVIMTCRNRRDKTVACLRSLRAQRVDSGVTMEVFLTDDGSTDGTAEAVRAVFPDIHILAGDGTLYWNRGMRAAWQQAVAGAFDGYLWLNDDAVLQEDAVGRLRDVARRGAIAVGTTSNAAGTQATYGGLRRRTGRLAFEVLEPGAEARACDTFNGTCVLIPAEVVQRVGLLDGVFRHALGDIDFGLRARRARCAALIVPGYVGTCARNAAAQTWRDETLGLRQRFELMCGPKGLPPREWLAFAARHGGPAWPGLFVSPYVKVALSAGAGSWRKAARGGAGAKQGETCKAL